MRHVRVTASDEIRDAVIDVLEEAGVEYAVTDDTSGGEVNHVFTFPARTEDVEGILDALKEVGVGEEGKGNVVVSEVEAVVSEGFEEEKEEEENGDERIARRTQGDRRRPVT